MSFVGFLSLGLWVVTVALLVPVVVVCAEIAAAFLPKRRDRFDAGGKRPRIGVLIPAHQEAEGLARTLASVRAQLEGDDRVLVVADNCIDATADVARAAGAEVVERADLVRRGKGYALDAGVTHFAGDPPAVVIIIDADVTLQPGAIESLARQAAHTDRPAQGLYLLHESGTHDRHDLISHLAFLVRNLVRPLGLARLGGPSPLFGAGMAFPWQVIRDAALANGDLVEDMRLGLDLAIVGRAALLCPGASIDGVLPKSHAAATTQRRRWEHGHFRTIVARVPHAFLVGLFTGRPQAMMLALDLATPPLAFHGLLLIAACAVALALALWHVVSFAPAIVLAFGFAALVAGLLAVWAWFSPIEVTLRHAMRVPGYVLRKLPMYGPLFIRRGQREWQRTARDAQPSDQTAAVVSPVPPADDQTTAAP